MRVPAICIILIGLLAGCEQAMVSGPVGGAEVTVTDLRSGAVLSSGMLTDDLDTVQQDYEQFDEFNDTTRLGVLGTIDLTALSLDPEQWYLVSVEGGFDYGLDGSSLDQADATPVVGPARALMSGAQLLKGGFVVGALSEAAWQWLRNHYAVMSDAELAAALDELANNLVLDVRFPEEDVIDYDDLLTWNPIYYDASLYKGPTAALEEMQVAIASGAADSERLAIAQQMISLGVPAGASDAWFREVVSPDIAQGKCINCHVQGGIAGNTNHVLVDDALSGHLDQNYAMYDELVDLLGVAAILNKAQGLNHQGGVQLTVGSDDYLALETYLNLLAGSNNGGAGLEDLFQGYALAGPEETLRRASLILAGTLPSEDDLAAVAGGDDETLRFMIRFLMQGEGFHRFLIEGANDRLLTDKWIEDLPVELFFAPYYPDLVNRVAELSDAGEQDELFKLVYGTAFGVAREPLELIAHVVEQELPYTEILTADYTMVNPQLALAYRAQASFPDDDWDIDQWVPGTVQGYTRIDDSTVYEEAEDIGAYVSGGLPTYYPHAGVLNAPGWLARYPSTDTNRNRARSRWTWYHFLGFDIERSAPRTTDPDALSDTDNPTLKNENCAVCHETMDPVAGAYQNYGDDGFYKDKLGGQDSLPILYKRDRDAEEPYQLGDTWYNDMREPGFDGQQFTDTEATLQSLAAAITSDFRFGLGTVKFWWPALIGEEVARSPADENDVDYAEQLALFQSQSAFVEELASDFVQGIDGGAAYNLKDLLLEIILSPWFRLDRATESAEDNGALRAAGTNKLLTPEQLDRKTEAVTGFRWYEQELYGVSNSQLTDQYRLFYGGIDSDGVTARATEMTALMSTVVEAQPLQMGCVLVAIEFQYPVSGRQIFTQVEKNQHEANAEAAIRRQLQYMHQRFLGESVTTNDPEIDRALALFTETRAERIQNGYPSRLNGNRNESCPFQLFDTGGWDLADPSHTMNSWVSMLIYYMTDYRYVYE